MLCLACITGLVFHRRVGGKELPFLVTVLDTWLILRITQQKSLSMRAPVYDVAPPKLLVGERPVLFGVGNLGFRRHLNDDLSSRLGCSKGNSLDDLPSGVFSAKFDLLAGFQDMPVDP